MSTTSRLQRQDDAIGGYFGLEGTAQAQPRPYHPGCEAFQSGRAAFLALLQARRPDRVWMPWYLCDSLWEPLRQTGIPGVRYALTEDFRPEGEIRLEAGDLLLYVNYFGLCDAVEDELLRRHPRQQLVFDHAQAFFSPPPAVLATLYSPRKFMGVPDGGYLHAPSVALLPREVDTGSEKRCAHLLARAARHAEAGYADYGRSEQSLCGLPALRMSALTGMLLALVPHDKIRARRRENFACLHDMLGPHNALTLSLAQDAAPLCYPFLPPADGPRLRERLIAERVFVPRYWPDLLSQDGLPANERRWVDGLLPLPIDQRYTPEQLATRVAQPLLSLLHPTL